MKKFMNAFIIALALTANALPAAEPTLDELHAAIEHNNIPVLDTLLQQNPNIFELDIEKGTPLHYAVKKNNQEAVQALLNYATQKNLLFHILDSRDCDNLTPLEFADRLGRTGCATLMRKYQNMIAFDYDEAGNAHPLPTTPVRQPASRDNQLIVSYSTLNKPIKLRTAIITKNVTQAEDLLTENKDLLLDQDSNKDTLLHGAVLVDSFECAQVILAHAQQQNVLNAILNAQNAQGQTALHMAVMKKTVMLIADDETVKPTSHMIEDSRFAQEIIDYAQTSGTLSLIINMSDNKNETPLHLAAKAKNDVCIRLLLSQGADTQARNSMGLSPVDLLRKREDADLITLFKTQQKKQKQEKCVIC
ncbi:ankyrin repeat domain-containing protein [Candidatus Babeliales bacterium]|nr:ankyrin repeat domain-containing protein [Candidatus Babeliales bacterium]